MGIIKQILNQNNNTFIDYQYEKLESEAWTEPTLDCTITDESIQSIIYHCYYPSELNGQNYDDINDTYDIHSALTQDFVCNHPDEAQHFFSPLDGKYSSVAKKIGYQDEDGPRTTLNGIPQSENNKIGFSDDDIDNDVKPYIPRYEEV